MSRYINAEWLLDYFAEDIDYYGKYVREDLLDNMPSIDICVCKECKHYKYDWCHRLANVVKPDDFCSYGERSE